MVRSLRFGRSLGTSHRNGPRYPSASPGTPVWPSLHLAALVLWLQFWVMYILYFHWTQSEMILCTGSLGNHTCWGMGMSKMDAFIALMGFTDTCEKWTSKQPKATQCDETAASSWRMCPRRSCPFYVCACMSLCKYSRIVVSTIWRRLI